MRAAARRLRLLPAAPARWRGWQLLWGGQRQAVFPRVRSSRWVFSVALLNIELLRAKLQCRVPSAALHHPQSSARYRTRIMSPARRNSKPSACCRSKPRLRLQLISCSPYCPPMNRGIYNYRDAAINPAYGVASSGESGAADRPQSTLTVLLVLILNQLRQPRALTMPIFKLACRLVFS